MQFKIGDRVRVTLSNGYQSEGVIERLYKNGGLGVREHSICESESRTLKGGKDAYHTRRACDCTII